MSGGSRYGAGPQGASGTAPIVRPSSPLNKRVALSREPRSISVTGPPAHSLQIDSRRRSTEADSHVPETIEASDSLSSSDFSSSKRSITGRGSNEAHVGMTETMVARSEPPRISQIT